MFVREDSMKSRVHLQTKEVPKVAEILDVEGVMEHDLEFLHILMSDPGYERIIYIHQEKYDTPITLIEKKRGVILTLSEEEAKKNGVKHLKPCPGSLL